MLVPLELIWLTFQIKPVVWTVWLENPETRPMADRNGLAQQDRQQLLYKLADDFELTWKS